MKRVLVLALALGSALAAAQRPEPSPPAERSRLEPAAVSHLRTVAVSFLADVPTSSELAPLLGMVESARVIGIGESTHGDFQSQTFKGHLIRELVRKGAIDTLIFEINRGAGAKIDAYVNQGKGDFADVFMNAGIFSIWRTDEMASLLGWLRAYVLNTGKPVRVYGVDCQDPATDLQLALAFLEKADRGAARRLREPFVQLFLDDKQDKTYYAWVKAQKPDAYAGFSDVVKEAEALLEKNKERWQKRSGFDEAQYALRSAWQALHSFEFEFGPGPVDYSKLKPADYSRRDRHMAENVLARIGEERRAAIWAHNGHVLPIIAPPYDEMGFGTLGSVLRGALGPKYVAVGFTWARGAIHAKPISNSAPDVLAAQKAAYEVMPLISDRPGDIGEFLGRVGPDRFYVDLRRPSAELAEWGKLAYYIPGAGFALDPKEWLSTADQTGNLIPGYDVLVFNRVVSPSTLWNVPRKPNP